MNDPYQSKRVLIADDEDGVRELVVEIVELAGYSKPEWIIDTAANGTEARAALRRNPYRILITDNNMPGMDGIDVIEECSDAAAYKYLLTGKSTEELQRRAEAAGAVFFEKPITNIQGFIAQLKSHYPKY